MINVYFDKRSRNEWRVEFALADHEVNYDLQTGLVAIRRKADGKLAGLYPPGGYLALEIEYDG